MYISDPPVLDYSWPSRVSIWCDSITPSRSGIIKDWCIHSVISTVSSSWHDSDSHCRAAFCLNYVVNGSGRGDSYCWVVTIKLTALLTLPVAKSVSSIQCSKSGRSLRHQSFCLPHLSWWCLTHLLIHFPTFPLDNYEECYGLLSPLRPFVWMNMSEADLNVDLYFSAKWRLIHKLLAKSAQYIL